MENYLLDITGAEREFYGGRLILLEGVIEEFLSCLHMIRRYQVSRGHRDPVASFQRMWLRLLYPATGKIRCADFSCR